MTKIPEQVTALNKSAIEAALSFAQVSMESAEKLVRLQFEATRQFVAEQGETAKVLTEAKDPEAILAARARIAEKAADRALGYSRNVYDVAAQAQQQLGQLVEQRFAAFQREMTEAMEQVMKAAPGGPNVAAETVKSTMAATQAAVDNMTKAAKQMAELAEANIRAISEAASGALKTGASVKKK
jgi:phasin family protein